MWNMNVGFSVKDPGKVFIGVTRKGVSPEVVAKMTADTNSQTPAWPLSQDLYDALVDAIPKAVNDGPSVVDRIKALAAEKLTTGGLSEVKQKKVGLKQKDVDNLLLNTVA